MLSHHIAIGKMADTNLTQIFDAPPINPLREVFAYESLWTHQGAWFANIADLFRKHPTALPSELVTESDIENARNSLISTYGADRLRNIGIRINGAGEYPKKLRDADHPVELLYYSGYWELIDTPSVAIVGTRSPSEEGEHNARRIAHSLSKQGYTIVSGLAKGIDTAAHTEAIQANGKTIAVIGTPLFDYYPKENKILQDTIAEKHLLISQVPFLRYKNQNFKTNRLFFPARNVTMSAITMATIIVEAGNTSGTLVQARAALAQGRKLFILESCFRNPELTWPRRFEKQGATRVRNVTEVMELLENDKTHKARP